MLCTCSSLSQITTQKEMNLSFGKEMREKGFTLKEGITFVNHGAFGAVPKQVQEAQRRLMDDMYELPDLWGNKTESKKLEEATTALAGFVKADSDDFVFVQNTTTGVNTVLKSLKLNPDDIILYTDMAYCAIQYTCEELVKHSESKGVKTHALSFEFPIKSENDVIESFRSYFSKNKNVKIAIIEHISSPLSVRLPIEKLIPLCKEYGVLSLIDGAHALGQIPLNLRELNADFYTENLHKWFYCPRGCGFLYMKKIHKDWVKPLVTSFRYFEGFHNMFHTQGTRDTSVFCVVPEAIKFYSDIGGYEKIHNYAAPLLEKAASMLTSAWKTNTLNIPKSMEPPFMRLVQLPQQKEQLTDEGKQNKIVDNIIRNKIAIYPVIFGEHTYLRITANIYNTEEDYKKLCQIIEDGLF
ncbi:uncharacterized protein [Mytilus edulis]|uniref:uncharacterized protein n=1 Tax=Mytilus edulis TaxID=6550 RepID=UPI0039EE5CFC